MFYVEIGRKPQNSSSLNVNSRDNFERILLEAGESETELQLSFGYGQIGERAMLKEKPTQCRTLQWLHCFGVFGQNKTQGFAMTRGNRWKMLGRHCCCMPREWTLVCPACKHQTTYLLRATPVLAFTPHPQFSFIPLDPGESLNMYLIIFSMKLMGPPPPTPQGPVQKKKSNDSQYVILFYFFEKKGVGFSSKICSLINLLGVNKNKLIKGNTSNPPELQIISSATTFKHKNKNVLVMFLPTTSAFPQKLCNT